MTAGEEVAESCLQTCKIRTVMRSDGGIENTVGTLVKQVLR